VILGHLQRGGAPTAFDRVLGIRLGLKAVDMVLNEKFGYMAALRETEIIEVPLEEAVGRLKTVSSDLWSEIKEVLE